MVKKLLLLVLICGFFGIINAELPVLSTCPYPTIDEPNLTKFEPFDTKQPEDTIKYDGVTYTGIGLQNGGTFYAAVRFTPTSACSIKSAIFYQYQAVSASGWVYLREAGTATAPGAKIDSVSYTNSPGAWRRVNFPTARYRAAGVDFWIAIKVTHTAGTFPLGADAGPSVTPYRSFVSIDGTTWYNLPAVGVNYNWNIRAIGRYILGSNDVGIDAIIAPGSIHNVNTQMAPIARVKNYGTSPQSNFQVVCTIIGPAKDVRYSAVETVTTLAAGDTTRVNFDPWTPTITENLLVIMRTNLAGDGNSANDRLTQTTQVGAFLLYENFTGTTFPPTGWTRISLNAGDSTWQRRTIMFRSAPAAAVVWWSWQQQSEWLITPFVTLTGSPTGNYFLKWWYYGYRRSTYGDHYYTKITTNGTDWTTLYNLSTLTPPDTGWNYYATPVQINLSSYAGQSVKIAWHAFDGYPTNTGMWYQWGIDDIEITYVVGIEEEKPNNKMKTITTLNAPKPNPVTDGLAKISFTIAEPTKASLKIYDASGKLIKTLVNSNLEQGVYNLSWNGTDNNNNKVAEGIYFYTLTTDKQNFTKKLVLTR